MVISADDDSGSTQILNLRDPIARRGNVVYRLLLKANRKCNCSKTSNQNQNIFR